MKPLSVEELRKTYPINTFYGTTQEELLELIEHQTKLARINELSIAREYCAGGQGCEYQKLLDRIKQLQGEIE